ncbi:DDB1- and CUL4-associated factor 6 isoform X2 [Ptiloglossa arizonensis]|uniref:DDB1- and CUL4-associated factor 6 isoform X2 n=1 Tax=Ptiloglossa arizonensis TaxID=3350558 RepID=UPI003F9F6F61
MTKTRSNLFRDIYYLPYNECSKTKLYSSSKASLQMMQRMALLKKFKVHNGCVNSVCWNATGELILSGSDDLHLVLTNAYTYKVVTDYKTSHKANIFSAKLLPNSGDHRIVSCSGHGTILYTDLMRKTETFHNQFNCHNGTTYEVATMPDEPHTFLSCGEDATVRLFDLRIKEKCNALNCRKDVLVSCKSPVTALSVNLASPHQIAIGCSDSTVRIFDRRTLGTSATGWTQLATEDFAMCTFTVPELEGKSHRMTSINFSPDGQDVLVSYSSDHIYLFNVKDQGIVQLRKDIKAGKGEGRKQRLRSPLPVRRLRLRGDWSDTGPHARPECEGGRHNGIEIAQARPVLHNSLMQRMTEVLSRMLSDPATRAALFTVGQDSLEDVIDQQYNVQNNNENAVEGSEERHNEPEGAERVPTQSTQETDVAEQQTEELEGASFNGTQTEAEAICTAKMNKQSPSETTLSNPTTDENPIESKSNVPMKTESSQTNTQKCSVQPCTSRAVDICNDAPEEDENDVQSLCTYMRMNPNQHRHLVEDIQNRLAKIRADFLEEYGCEPVPMSRKFTDLLDPQNYRPGPSGSRSNATFSGKSHDKQLRHSDIQEKTDESAFTDSDDDDTEFRERLRSRMEEDMDEATGDDRPRHRFGTSEKAYVRKLRVKQKYMGHRNARTMVKEANFWGNDIVMSGSDCGHVFIWDKETAKLCMLLEADQHVVNCLQPHPYLPLLATAGIDYDIKLWAPINEESTFDEKFAEDLQKRNAIMLEETRYTMTVPPSFMIRMLACFNQLRRGRARTRSRAGWKPTELRE